MVFFGVDFPLLEVLGFTAALFDVTNLSVSGIFFALLGF